MKTIRAVYSAGIVAQVLLLASPVWAVSIDTVLVGNAGNVGYFVEPMDDAFTGFLGGVDYDFLIGKTEVTNDQYVEFLNAKAASDPLGLYDTNMGTHIRGGITRSGSDGSYTYSLKPNMGNKPVNVVTWYDAARFANWMHNGQGNGDTESGAYTLEGNTPLPTNASSIIRNPGAKWFLPSDDEWYKAAYYDPTISIFNEETEETEETGGYWDFPTRTNDLPTAATANGVGDISNSGANIANFGSIANWNSLAGNLTTVGSAGPLSASYYGTFDQGGNVSEWNDFLLINESAVLYRGLRGGNVLSDVYGMQAGGAPANQEPHQIGTNIGFRLAAIPVPEPALSTMIISASIGLFGMRRRLRAAFRGKPVRGDR